MQAGAEGACLVVLPAEAFEGLVAHALRFGREWRAQLAHRMAPPVEGTGAWP
jgi:hypothetical protein